VSTTSLRVPLAPALRIASAVVESLSPGCLRIEIAGSIRRQAETVGDIEIVAIPRMDSGGGLFGEECRSALMPILSRLTAEGRLQLLRGGERMRRYWLPRAQVHLDLFLVTSATWGVQLAIRTGPGDFSRRLVTQRCRGGLLIDGLEVCDGRVWAGAGHPLAAAAQDIAKFADGVGGWRTMHRLDTPEESDFFTFCGGWVAPEDRPGGP